MKRSRHELQVRLGEELGREISAQTIFFHEGAARRLGLNATDTRCLDLIARSSNAEYTAGDLGRATGLTTGAVTGILDRLEAGGFVERVRDANDRRRVFIRPRPEAAGRLEETYRDLAKAMRALVDEYKTSELELICGFLERNLAILREQTARLA